MNGYFYREFNLKFKKGIFIFWLVDILDLNTKSSDAEYNVKSNSFDEEKIREIVSDSIDYYLGKTI